MNGLGGRTIQIAIPWSLTGLNDTTSDLVRTPLPVATRFVAAFEEYIGGLPGPITVARRLSSNGFEAWEQVKQNGWEGLVAEDADSVYSAGTRTTAWIKVKHRIRTG